MLFEKSIFQFLKDLALNNNRDWFAEQKLVFKKTQSYVKQYYDAIGENLEKHDEIACIKLFRIYRDIRFSKDKTPYKTHFSGGFERKGKALRGGYYLEIKPNNTFLAGGFWQPEKEDLLRIRKDFENDDSEIRAILRHPDFKTHFGGKLHGEALKTAPKGFDKQHPAIDLIRKKGFIAVRNFTDKEVFDNNFLSEIDKSYRVLRPFFNYMSEVLTTNTNGESILQEK